MTGHPRVLAAHGGRSGAAARFGAVLAQLIGARLVVARVYEHVLGEPGPGTITRARFDAAQAAIDHARAIAHVDTQASYETIAGGDIARSLVSRARTLNASVLVLGADLRGHVTRDVLRHGPCPIAVAPDDRLLVGDRLTRIGVAYDGSVGSEFAAEVGQRLAACADAALELIAVARSDRDANELDDLVDHKAVLVNGRKAQYQVVRGRPGRELRRASRRLDLLCCGSHGRVGLAGALLGSVSSVLVDQPVCPVLVVPVRSRRDPHAPLGVTTAGDARVATTAA